ncbi:MAG: hypothetical protein HQL66_00620 [Magnetococcales bacterium]|nr:hypothetical protein [Magnetococcales bacterium]
MSLRMKCPRCGGDAEIEAYQATSDDRDALLMIARLPPAVADKAVWYLELFRAPGGGMTHRRRKDLLASIASLVASGTIKSKTEVPLPCAPEIWGEALRIVLTQAETGIVKTPLSSHGYWLSITRSLADEAAKKGEKQREVERRREAEWRRATRADDVPAPEEEVISAGRERAEISRLLLAATRATIGLTTKDLAAEERCTRMQEIHTRALETSVTEVELAALLHEAREVMHGTQS